MVRCEYCDNVYYGNEKNCTSCGAALPRVKPPETKTNTVNNRPIVNNANNRTTKPNQTQNKIITIYILALVVVIFISIISIFIKATNEPTLPIPDLPDTPAPIEVKSKYNESDLINFDSFNEKFIANPADSEAVLFLIWYYLYNSQPDKAYEVTNIFFEQKVKDDSEIYIEIANIYIDAEVYGYALYTLNKGYELTKLDSINNYANELTVESFLQNEQMGEMLTLMFGKNLSLIKYEDLASIQSIIIDVTGRELLYSTEEPILKDGYIENFEEYKNGMKSISLELSINNSTEFDIFVNLKVLVDESGSTISLNWLPYLSNIYYLESRPDEDFESIPVIPNLKGLALNNSYVKAIKNIEKFTNLEYLRINETEIFDITNVGKLENLKTLSLEDNENLINLEAILTISSLKNLEIIEMDIVALNIDTSIMQLEKLVINDTGVRNVDFITNLSSLKELAIINNYDLTTIPNLGNLMQLETLKVQTTKKGTNYVHSVDFIRGLTSVKKLSISGNLHDISAVGTMTGLEELTLNIGVIDGNLSSLSSLTNLKKLTFKGRPMNDINDVSFLSSLTNLTYLDISDAGYVKGNSIFNLNKLEVLYLSNFVGNFGNISNLKNLKELYLDSLYITTGVYADSYGGITSIYTDGDINLSTYSNQLSQLTNLEKLSISNNELDNIEFVRNLSKLEKLNVNDNYITSLEPLANLENLNYLSVIKNPISNWASLREKKNLELVEQ